MTWTYSGDPTTSPRDAVRFWCQDTLAERPLLADEEIDYLVGLAAPIWDHDVATAALAADAIVAKFSGEPTISGDGVSIDFSTVVTQYRALGESLRDQYDRMAGAGAMPIAFGIDLIAVTDPSVRPPSFGKGFMDNPRAGGQEYGNREHDAQWSYPDSGYWTGP